MYSGYVDFFACFRAYISSNSLHAGYICDKFYLRSTCLSISIYLYIYLNVKMSQFNYSLYMKFDTGDRRTEPVHVFHILTFNYMFVFCLHT